MIRLALLCFYLHLTNTFSEVSKPNRASKCAPLRHRHLIGLFRENPLPAETQISFRPHKPPIGAIIAISNL